MPSQLYQLGRALLISFVVNVSAPMPANIEVCGCLLNSRCLHSTLYRSRTMYMTNTSYSYIIRWFESWRDLGFFVPAAPHHLCKISQQLHVMDWCPNSPCIRWWSIRPGFFWYLFLSMCWHSLRSCACQQIVGACLLNSVRTRSYVKSRSLPYHFVQNEMNANSKQKWQ